MTDDQTPGPEARPPTTRLSAFHDLRPTEDVGSGSWWSAPRASNLALVCGLVVALSTVLIGIIGSTQAGKEGGRPVVLVLFAVVACVGVLGVVAAARALAYVRRTRASGTGRALSGSVLAVGAIVLLSIVLFRPDPAVRAPGNGPILEAGPLEVTLLLRGDCLTELPDARFDDPTTTTDVVPCADPHAYEVVDVLDFPDDESAMQSLCDEATAGNGHTGPVHVLAPTLEVRRSYGVGQLLCLQP